jgi:hypothetical protein
MLSRPKVLAITKRTADLCATQGLLYAAGMDLIVATNVVTAKALIRSVPVRGVIICYHSWTEAERESIATELSKGDVPVLPTINCPGCTGCDEACGKRGVLDDTLPLTSLIMQLK